MAVIYVDELFSSGIATATDEKGLITATATRNFNAFVNNPADNEGIVKFSPLIPADKSPHPYFHGLRCNNVSVQRRGALHFEVAVSYESPPYKEPDENGQEQGPLTQPTQINYFSITSEEAIEDDITGKPIVTKNGEPIEGLTRPISDLGIRLQKNFASFDPATFYLYSDCVNSDTFLGFPPGTLRIASIQADEQFYTDEEGNEIIYFNIQVEIHARKPYQVPAAKSWYKRVRHEGYYIKESNSSNKSVRALDNEGMPVSKPVLLDDKGFQLPIPANALTVTADYLLFEVFEQISFASMGF
jgi:hypothetical protein